MGALDLLLRLAGPSVTPDARRTATQEWARAITCPVSVWAQVTRWRAWSRRSATRDRTRGGPCTATGPGPRAGQDWPSRSAHPQFLRPPRAVNLNDRRACKQLLSGCCSLANRAGGLRSPRCHAEYYANRAKSRASPLRDRSRRPHDSYVEGSEKRSASKSTLTVLALAHPGAGAEPPPKTIGAPCLI